LLRSLAVDTRVIENARKPRVGEILYTVRLVPDTVAATNAHSPMFKVSPVAASYSIFELFQLAVTGLPTEPLRNKATKVAGEAIRVSMIPQ
jgi:hypothetical protein